MNKSSKSSANNHSNQLNSNKGTNGINSARQAANDNRSVQLNPNNSAFKGASIRKK